MMNSINGLDGTQELLIKLLDQNPDDWGMRKKVVWFLYEAGNFREASKIIWNAPEIPPIDTEIIFAARVVSKGQPIRAIRLLNAVMDRNKDEPQKNLAMAKELIKGGMPLQATRFYGAATLMDKTLIDEEFEMAIITTDADEEDWSEVVQGEEFPWDAPIELSEANVTSHIDGESEEGGEGDEATAGKAVRVKAPVKSLTETMDNSEKAVDLRDDLQPLPLNPDKISTQAVTMSVQVKEAQDAAGHKAKVNVIGKTSSEEVVSDPIENKVHERPKLQPDPLSASQPASQQETQTSSIKLVSPDVSNDDVAEEEDEPVAAKKGMFSSLMGFFRRSKKQEEVSQSEPKTASAPASSLKPQLVKPMAFTPPTAGTPMRSGPMVGPVKPKPVPVPSELQGGGGGRQYGQPEALDCRTRLVALAPQDGSAFFQELLEKYANPSNPENTRIITIAREEGNLDYLSLIEKACSNDKSVNLDSFSTLLGLHACMTTADCNEWVEDMNILRKGFGDAVLATVVSKYSVSECRDILGAVYRRTATKAAI